MMQPRIKAVFLGSKGLGLNVFTCLVDAHPFVDWVIIHPDDSADARSQIDAFRVTAEARNIPFHIASTPSAARRILAENKYQIGFVCGWYWLFTATDLDTFELGLWGIHNSLLPKFRGGAPLVWSIIAGEREVGSTIFKMSPNMDDGDVLMQVRIPLTIIDTVGSALDRIEAALLVDLGRKWCSLLDGTAILIKQDERQATYCGQRTDEDGCIDWTLPALRVHDFIRAQSEPYPGAWTWHEGSRLRIEKSMVFQGTYFGTAGQILRRLDKTVLVACGKNTAIQIVSVRKEGDKHTLLAADVIGSIQTRLRMSKAEC